MGGAPGGRVGGVRMEQGEVIGVGGFHHSLFRALRALSRRDAQQFSSAVDLARLRLVETCQGMMGEENEKSLFEVVVRLQMLAEAERAWLLLDDGAVG